MPMHGGSLSTMGLQLAILTILQVYCISLWVPFPTESLMRGLQLCLHDMT